MRTALSAALATTLSASPDFRCWHLTDIEDLPRNVRFQGNSGHPLLILYALVRSGSIQPFAAHLIAPGFKPPAIAKAHFLMRGTTSIGLVRLAQ
jgi:hypothetical protein